MNAKMQNMVKIAMNKSLLKEYNVNGKRVVYLNDGDEFQIQILNPHPFRIGVSIKFNDSFYSTRKLVINPGERIWLERYLDDNKKLCFKSYWVDKDNPVVDNAIADNGKISIEFYKEQEFKPIIYTTYEPHIYYNTITTSTTQPTIRYSNFTAGTADIKANYCQSTLDINTTTSATAASTGTHWTSAMTDARLFADTHANSCQKETGRIEKGNYSHQNFSETSLNLESYAFEWETVYILPLSEKPITNNDLQKRYCPNCGRKLKSKFKFCPFCREKL